MSFRPLFGNKLARKALYKLAHWRVQEKIRSLRPVLDKKGRILDIGSGNCVIVEALRAEEYSVEALDINNNSLVQGISPILFDGRRMPFKDKQFDVALLVTVLHHIPDPEATLAEAARVARRVVVIEEIYSNVLTKYLTFFIDSLFNLEFINHPHTNKTDKGWRASFKRLGLEVKDAKHSRSLGVLQRVQYFLQA